MKRRNGEGSVYRRDRGGEAALVVQGRGAGNLRNAGLDVQVVTLPNGTDPAEHLAHRDNTLEVFRPDQAVPLLTAQVHRAVAAQGDHIQWVEGRRTAARTIVRYLATYPASYTPQNRLDRQRSAPGRIDVHRRGRGGLPPQGRTFTGRGKRRAIVDALIRVRDQTRALSHARF
jgi:hypothetical protein